MKKILSVLLILILTVFTGGCGSIAKADYDMTDFSSSMIYALYSDAYINGNYSLYTEKTVIIDGVFRTNESGYKFVTGYDSTGCCSWGFELIRNDNLPYPEEGTSVRIHGTFGMYDEDGQQYFCIRIDDDGVTEK